MSRINDLTTIQEPLVSRGLYKISQNKLKKIKPIRLKTESKKRQVILLFVDKVWLAASREQYKFSFHPH